MELNDYQRNALTTAIFPNIGEWSFVYPALKLAGEAGEVAEKVGKLFRDVIGDRTELTQAEWDEFRFMMRKELGDVLWYVAVLAHLMEFSLNEIGRANLDKLQDRKLRGMLKGSGDDR